MKIEDLIDKVKQYPFFVVGLSVAILCLLVLYFRGSRAEEIEILTQEKDRAWSQIQKNIERSVGLENQVKKMEDFRQALDQRLMNPESVAINYEFFYSIERRTDTQITAINQGSVPVEKMIPDQLPKMKNFSVIPYVLVVQGNYNELLRFVYLLERGQYIVRIDSLNVSADSNELEGEVLTARLECFVLGGKDV